MAEVIVTHFANGETKVQVKGVKGRKCRALTKAFEESLGKRTKTTDTPEMTQAVQQQVKLNQ